MDEPTTGRRHVRAGSVHVTELLGPQRRRFLLSGTSPEELDPTAAAHEDRPEEADPDAPTPHRRPPPAFAHRIKIVCLTLSLLALCASLVFGTISGDHRGAPVSRPGPPISGEQALLPPLLNSVLPGLPTISATSTTVTGVIESAGTTRRSGSETAPPTVTYVAPRNSNASLVERFYQLIRTAPDRAFPLLDGTLFGIDLGEFVRSWAGVTDLQVLDLRDQGDDVLATVRMRLPDGSHLQIEQLLDVTSTLPQRIVGARLLSARRS
ncbi:MAG TPA: hypothetical protein VFV67_13060 [Actinophytocola sp.]|uniref:hypothetical protein n=1 Tax=Actinophytocola sp. TaxID=1872138 RepID=UPI002DB84837|nr:hypothetical protein [Actinophytocola sp.]HEU5471576.1 hypothetical protein [Actinophytocola sp.]